ncbi:MAG: flagellar basal body rod protein FlgB [Lachnospira sp.]|nr:flagellar basal body rod protein FlgB [Lachnospira sp.]
MNSASFGYIDVLKTAADASWLREEVLTNNIANVSTPNYKRQDVEFTSYLKSAIEQAGTPSSTLTKKVNEANLSGITTRTYTENTTLSYRLDGNNVDLSTENAELAAEQIKYNALIDSMNNEFSRMKAVLK